MAASQTRAVLSFDPVATLDPSGLQHTDHTAEECPLMVRRQAHAASPCVPAVVERDGVGGGVERDGPGPGTDQRRAVLSPDPVATLDPSGLQHTDLT